MWYDQYRSNIIEFFPTIKTGEKIAGFDIYNYQMLFDDEDTKRMIREGNTIGCFYIESPGMRNLLKKMKSDSFEMLTAISSIIRPGVAESGMMKEFIERHHNPSRRKYLVPELGEILKETYGVMIYQEDVIKVAHLVAGLTLAEADLLRRAMSGKMRSHLAMKKLQDKFFENCQAKYSIDITKELWRQIESFAGYAFCKAHSASFALLSFQNAYLKSHYPAEFMSSVLTNQGGYYMPAVYLQEARRLGIKILPLSINESEKHYTGEKDWIRIGLMATKNLSTSSIDKILSEREKYGKYKSLNDFLKRTGIGYEEATILIRVGALDEFFLSRITLMRLLDIEFHHKKLLTKNTRDLFEDNYDLTNPKNLEKTRNHLKKLNIYTDKEYSITEKCKIEYETYGFMVSRHPLQFYQKVYNEIKITDAKDFKANKGKRVKALGWLMTSKRIRTRKGDIMKFLSLEDLTGTFEVVVFPKEYEKYALLTLSMGPYLVEGFIDNDNGDTIVAKKLEVISAHRALRQNQLDAAETEYINKEKFYPEEVELLEAIDEEFIYKQAYNF